VLLGYVSITRLNAVNSCGVLHNRKTDDFPKKQRKKQQKKLKNSTEYPMIHAVTESID